MHNECYSFNLLLYMVRLSIMILPYPSKMKRHWAPTASNRRPVLTEMPFCGRPRKPRPLR
ncbi:hypothetical protein BDV28DRAFT_128190 [Aspergillus coremiiformis]|uniref:Uncharacterized protein n=1 Tax=Aspergillus coremiiformis TaxID=138285 RepID=A0A5N6ZF45_9EURO|nr:hypothetical protein BDV28DRAFT_128190 [Aspergillus coremiiformis]